MRVLQDLGAEFESGRIAVKCADDRDAVAVLGKDLDLVQRADIRAADVEPRNDEHDRLVDAGEVRVKRRFPLDHVELARRAGRNIGEPTTLDEFLVLLVDASFQRRKAVDKQVPPSLFPEGSRVAAVPVERFGNGTTPVPMLQRQIVPVLVGRFFDPVRAEKKKELHTSARQSQKSQSSPPTAKLTGSYQHDDPNTAREV